ncbi:MAG: hypothetical protein QG640_173 [Patescibacteria group bacterium]|nr:hypothetical protein [Patescibacteria group bacterium]
MLNNTFELVLILFSLIVGMLSALYFYQSTDIFTTILQKPLKYISTGVIMIMLGIFLAVFISFEQSIGNAVYVYTIPLNALFFLLYIIGSIFIFMGARQFSHKPLSQ